MCDLIFAYPMSMSDNEERELFDCKMIIHDSLKICENLRILHAGYCNAEAFHWEKYNFDILSCNIQRQLCKLKKQIFFNEVCVC